MKCEDRGADRFGLRPASKKYSTAELDDFVRKPYTPELVVVCIARHLDLLYA